MCDSWRELSARTAMLKDRTAASISVRLVRGMLRSIGCSLTFLILFVGHVMADGASAYCSEDAMMAGVMAGHSADQRALETAFRFG